MGDTRSAQLAAELRRLRSAAASAIASSAVRSPVRLGSLPEAGQAAFALRRSTAKRPSHSSSSTVRFSVRFSRFGRRTG